MAPPLLAGAEKETANALSLATTPDIKGAAGAAAGVTEICPLAMPEPCELTARILI